MSWVILPKTSPSTEVLLRRNYPVVGDVPDNLHMIVMNVPNIQKTLKNYVVLDYDGRLDPLLPQIQSVPVMAPRGEVSILGAYISWSDDDIVSELYDFKSKLNYDYSGICFYQPHGYSGLAGDDKLLVLHSANVLPRVPGFRSITKSKIFGYRIPEKFHYEVTRIPGFEFSDDSGEPVGVFVPPGDLVAYWPIAEIDSKEMHQAFKKFLEKSAEVINEHRNQKIIGNLECDRLAVINTLMFTKLHNLQRKVTDVVSSQLTNKALDAIYEAAKKAVGKYDDVKVEWFDLPPSLAIYFPKATAKTSDGKKVKMKDFVVQVNVYDFSIEATESNYPGVMDGKVFFFTSHEKILKKLLGWDFRGAIEEIIRSVHNWDQYATEYYNNIIKGGKNADQSD